MSKVFYWLQHSDQDAFYAKPLGISFDFYHANFGKPFVSVAAHTCKHVSALAYIDDLAVFDEKVNSAYWSSWSRGHDHREQGYKVCLRDLWSISVRPSQLILQQRDFISQRLSFVDSFLPLVLRDLFRIQEI